MSKITMPVGRDDFASLREGNYFYVDKTPLIKQIIDNGAQATLITRPRRFGKSLNMSMLDCFFDITRQNTNELFKGLKISADVELCDTWMKNYPTILISFKNVEGLKFEQAYGQLLSVISECFRNNLYIFNKDIFDEVTKKKFNDIYAGTADETAITDSLFFLSRILHEYHNKKVIVLIDEYDVPMAKGNTNGYYPKITNILRSLFGKVLKGNEHLEFAVVTGCLRIAKESIFTGLNNPDMDSISDERYDEYFGFTESEVEELLAKSELTSKKDIIKEWYDGYHYGDVDAYCPWDVICYVSRLLRNPKSKPKAFWSNTTGSDIIRPFLSKNQIKVSGLLEALINGGTVKAHVNEKLTYGDLNTDELDGFWSLLYLTGYLTPVNIDDETNEYDLKIPNKELRIIFKDSISNWYRNDVVPLSLGDIVRQLWSYDANGLTKSFTNLLTKSISGFDYSESFYHAFILGVLTLTPYRVKSNCETGEGRTDIFVIDNDRVAVIEFKITDNYAQIDTTADKSLKQIDEKRYTEEFIADGYPEIIKIGFGFFKKRCLIKMERVL